MAQRCFCERKGFEMTLTEIKNNWTATDEIIYRTPENKLKSLEAAKTRVPPVQTPADNEVCLWMISGNEKAMSSRDYSDFGTVVNGKLRKGRVVGHIA